jgi:hypothetical protein
MIVVAQNNAKLEENLALTNARELFKEQNPMFRVLCKDVVVARKY